MTNPPITLRANIDRKFYLQFLLIGIAAIGFALWSLFDGAVKYPNQRVRALEFEKLAEEGRMAEWQETARQRGWPTDRPGEPKTEIDFAMQFIMAGAAGTVGLAFLFVVFRSRGRWIEASESGMNSSWRQSFDFDRVVSIDKKKWKNKGIAKIKYEHGNRKKTFVLDNYKYDRKTTDKILYMLETKVGTDKITGGPPEPPPEKPGGDTPQKVTENLDNPD